MADETKIEKAVTPIQTTPQSGTRQDVFSLPEGAVIVHWSFPLSPDSFQDIDDWLDILKRKIGRSVK